MKIVFLIVLSFALSLNAQEFKIYKLSGFKSFKVYAPKGKYFLENLNTKTNNLIKFDIQKLQDLYIQEKIVRDLLLQLSLKYDYEFMPYIAMLTHKQLLILQAFYKKYSLKVPEDIDLVGNFSNKKTQENYHKLLEESLLSKKKAASLSVIFMKKLIKEYSTTAKGLPKSFKRQLMQSNAFNKKVLRMFKKGLRNIKMGLPVE